MRFIKNCRNHRKYIESAVKRWGGMAEHNFFHYKYNEDKARENCFFKLEKNMAVLCQHEKRKKAFYIFPSGLLCSEKRRIDAIFSVLDYALSSLKAAKVWVELDEPARREFLQRLKDSDKYRASKNYEVLYWPLYNMRKFDIKLSGRKWKKIRNIRNRFYKKHKIRFVDSAKVPRQDLLRILNLWIKRRNCNDKVGRGYYEALINSKFSGMTYAKTMLVDKRPCSITAGWRIPNSKNYYSHVGIFDYSIPGLGEIVNIEDIIMLKKKNFDYVDFGGSDKVLLYFKKKFRPERVYKTYIFSIFRRR